MSKFSDCKLVIFDFDGTLLNTIEDLADSVNHALTVFGYPNRSLAEVTLFVGNGMKNLIMRSVPEGTSETDIEKVLAEFLSHYKIHMTDKTRAYDGIYELLDTLKANGFLQAVASNKADHAVQDLCDQYFKGYFDLRAGERPEIAKKPSPDLIEYICKQLNVTLDECVLIGDSEVDVKTGINAKVKFIAVDWGFRSREVLMAAGAETIVSEPSEIFALLTK